MSSGGLELLTIKLLISMNKEQKQMMDRAIKFAPARQIFMWRWWEIFATKKQINL